MSGPAFNRNHPVYVGRYRQWLVNQAWENAISHKRAVTTDTQALRDNPSARNTFDYLSDLLSEDRPLDQLHAVHALAFAEAYANLELRRNQNLFSVTLFSLLLSVFPLRATHWPEMRIVSGDAPDPPPPFNSWLRVKQDGKEPHQYAICVRVAALKNARSNKRLRTTNERVISEPVPEAFGQLITDYLRIVRPAIGGRKRSPKRLPTSPAGPPILFLSQDGGAPTYLFLLRSIKLFQSQWWGAGGRGLVLSSHPDGVGIHAYRHILATHVLKTTGSLEAAAAILLDDVHVVKATYAQFLPSDGLSISRATRQPPSHLVFRP